MTLTSAGAVYIAITLLLGFAAVNTGNNLLYLLDSALLGFMAASGLLGRWNLAKLRFSCSPPREIFDGVPTLLTMEVANQRRFFPACLLAVAVADEQAFFPLIEPGTSERRCLRVIARGRGWQSLPALEVRSRFPVNFFIRKRVVNIESQVLIFPAPQPCLYLASSLPSGKPGTIQNSMRGGDDEISRIGEYRGGEPLKLIHWKLSARHDQLKVKELCLPAQPPVVIDVESLSDDGIEERLRCACWLVLRLIREGRCVGLRIGLLEAPPACNNDHKLRLLRILALYGHGQDTA